MENTFDFIPSMDRNNDLKRKELVLRTRNNDPCAIAFERVHQHALATVITRFSDFGKTITAEQCRSLADDLATVSGCSDIYSVRISLGVNKTAVFFVSQNCLRIFSGDRPVYENDNGRICRDANALSDCGTSKMWY